MVSSGHDEVARREGKPVYNLQKAKDEIDAVAKHATDVTEYVIALGDTVQALDGSLDRKLAAFKAELLGAIDARLADVRRAVLGTDGELAETSFVGDLGSKVSLLKRGAPSAVPDGEPNAGTEHAPQHPQPVDRQDNHQHDHHGDHHG